jgi:hypothetical protein
VTTATPEVKTATPEEPFEKVLEKDRKLVKLYNDLFKIGKKLNLAS